MILSCGCPHCGVELEFEAEQAGEVVPCPKCGGDLELINYGAPAKAEVVVEEEVVPPIVAPPRWESPAVIRSARPTSGPLVFGNESISPHQIVSVRYEDISAGCFPNGLFILGAMLGVSAVGSREWGTLVFGLFLCLIAYGVKRAHRPMSRVIVHLSSGREIIFTVPQIECLGVVGEIERRMRE